MQQSSRGGSGASSRQEWPLVRCPAGGRSPCVGPRDDFPEDQWEKESSGGGDGEWGEIRVPVALVRERPSTRSHAVSKLREGDRALILCNEGEWAVVELPGSALGWAHRSLFRESAPAKPTEGVTWNELKEIRFAVIGDEERVYITLARGQIPQISSPKGSPAVLCQFVAARLGNEVAKVLKTGGRLVREIRTFPGRGAPAERRSPFGSDPLSRERLPDRAMLPCEGESIHRHGKKSFQVITLRCASTR